MSKPKLFVIGDSISIGYGPTLQKSLADAFEYARKSGEQEAMLNLDKPMGANGGDSSMVLDYLHALKAGGVFHADVLVLNCGLHDIKTEKGQSGKQVPLEQYRENLKEIVAIARGLAEKIVWVRTTPVISEVHHRKKGFDRYEKDVDEYNALADEIMKEAGIPTADLFTFTSGLGLDESNVADGVHFSQDIQVKQGEFMAEYLRPFAG